MTQSISTLRCISCDARYDATLVRYRCDCGDLLEVHHDLEKIQASHGNLRELFERRLGSRDAIHGSGVWRYHEIILPDLPLADIVTCGEGNTTMYQSKTLSDFFNTKNLHLKHEGENPTLSFKDRGMTSGVSWARHLKAKIVACASTGDTSAAMAAYAAYSGDLRSVVFLPADKISPEQLSQPIAYGALTLALDTDFDGCMKLVREVCERHEIYLLNSMNSFRIEGQKAIGIEACQQLNWEPPDWFVIPVGNAGNISALGKGLREAHALGLIDRLPRIAGIQARAADPLYQSYLTDFQDRTVVKARPTAASAIQIGDPVSRDKAAQVVREFNGVLESVDEAALLAAKADADRAGVAVCPNSGVALAGLRALREKGTIGSGERVVVILTAHGLKFSQVGVEYHTGPDCPIPNPIVGVSADLASIEAKLGL